MRLFISLSLLLGWLLLQTAAWAGPGAKQGNEPGTPVPSLGNDHIRSIGTPHIPYNSDPPTSGPHVPFIAKWGIYKIPVPKELQVHNLEDGGVIIQYNCQSCDELIAKLQTLAKRYLEKAAREKFKAADPEMPTKYEHLILAPYPGMDATIALTAWGRIDKLKGYDEARITRFIEAYIGIDHHPRRE
jgi:Protein of unknown function (DUF3105)